MRSPQSGTVAVAPQVSCAPPYEQSVGFEAVAFYNSLRGVQVLDGWQSDWIIDTLGVREDGSWAAFESALAVQRQNGKGAATDTIELASLFLLAEKLTVHSAHQMKTCREAFLRIQQIIEQNLDLDRRVARVMRSKGEEGFELRVNDKDNPRGRLMFFSRSAGTGRGFSGNRNVLDEAQELEGEQMAAMVPTMAAQPDAQLIYTFTAPKLGTAHVCSLRRRAKAGDCSRLVYHGWENPTGIEYGDPAAWGAANPAYPRRITAERINDMRTALDDDELFRRECLGIWPTDAREKWAVISRTQWDAAHDQREVLPAITAPFALVADVAPDRSSAAICAAGPRIDGTAAVDITGNDETLDHREGTAWVIPRLKALSKHGPAVIAINDRALTEEAQRAGLTVYAISAADVVTSCSFFYDAITREGHRLYHLGQPSLTDAIAGATKRTVGAGGAWAWSRKDVLVDISPVVAGSLAVYLAATPRTHRQERAPAVAFVATSAQGPRRRPATLDEHGNRVINFGGSQ